jgi:hypothetical protein
MVRDSPDVNIIPVGGGRAVLLGVGETSDIIFLKFGYSDFLEKKHENHSSNP